MAVVAISISGSFALAKGSISPPLKAKIFEYKNLKRDAEKVQQYLHDYGFIAVRGGPGYVEKRAELLKMAQEFVTLDDATKAKCTPVNSFSSGWSYGIEKFNGKIDSFKGSYYVAVGENNPYVKDNLR